MRTVLFTIRAVSDTDRGPLVKTAAEVIAGEGGLDVRLLLDEPCPLVDEFAAALNKGVSLPDRVGHLLPIDGRLATLACQRLALDDELQRVSNGRMVCDI